MITFFFYSPSPFFPKLLCWSFWKLLFFLQFVYRNVFKFFIHHVCSFYNISLLFPRAPMIHTELAWSWEKGRNNEDKVLESTFGITHPHQSNIRKYQNIKIWQSKYENMKYENMKWRFVRPYLLIDLVHSYILYASVNLRPGNTTPKNSIFSR